MPVIGKAYWLSCPLTAAFEKFCVYSQSETTANDVTIHLIGYSKYSEAISTFCYKQTK